MSGDCLFIFDLFYEIRVMELVLVCFCLVFSLCNHIIDHRLNQHLLQIDIKREIADHRKLMEDIGLILVAQSIANSLGNEFDEYRFRKHLPLVLSVEDSTGEKAVEDIMAVVQRSLGLKL